MFLIFSTSYIYVYIYIYVFYTSLFEIRQIKQPLTFFLVISLRMHEPSWTIIWPSPNGRTAASPLTSWRQRAGCWERDPRMLAKRWQSTWQWPRCPKPCWWSCTSSCSMKLHGRWSHQHDPEFVPAVKSLKSLWIMPACSPHSAMQRSWHDVTRRLMSSWWTPFWASCLICLWFVWPHLERNLSNKHFDFVV